MPSLKPLIDRFGRTVRYLRLSVTDRCDFRCTYCMAEDMQFLPRKEVLNFEEMLLIAETFIGLGTEKIRITGGEPLIRANILDFVNRLGQLPGLKQLCLTTNGSHLERYAEGLKKAGVNNVNVSLDSLKPERFTELTRVGQLAKVLNGIDAAIAQNFDRIKINSVILKNYNIDETCDLVEYALSRSLDISFIEEMPLGEIQSHARDVEFVSSQTLRDIIAERFKLKEIADTTLGPSRYSEIEGFKSRVGFISPHSHNFCASCNRVRVTVAGRLLLCLGNEHSVDLRQILRENKNDKHYDVSAKLERAIIASMKIKPEKHEFELSETPQVLRFMNATGG